MAYFKVKTVDGEVNDYGKKVDRIDMSPGEKFVYLYQSVAMEDGTDGQIIQAIINSEDIESIVRVDEEEKKSKKAKAEK